MTIRTALKSASLAALALTLAACNSDDTGEGAPSGDAIDPIEAPAGQSWVETASETPEGGIVVGNPDAPIKLVEYASHTCGACAQFSQTGAASIENDYVASGRVSYEIRNLIRDPLDLTIALGARCGAAESFHPIANQAWGDFQNIMQTAYANEAAYNAALQQPPERRFVALAQLAGLPQFFAQRGISADQLATCLADTDKAAEIYKNSNDQAAELNITGTPTFFLNGRRVDENSWPKIEEALQNAGAR